MENSNREKNFRLFVVIFVSFIVLVRVCFYLYVGIVGIGKNKITDYFSIAINLLMFFSIFAYAINYFIKEKDASLSPLIFKFGLSCLATLIGLEAKNDILFVLSAALVFLVPYFSARITQKKSYKLNIVLLLAIFALSIALSTLFIINPHPKFSSDFSRLVYNLDALNPVVEWALFSFLFFARGIVLLKGERKEG